MLVIYVYFYILSKINFNKRIPWIFKKCDRVSIQISWNESGSEKVCFKILWLRNLNANYFFYKKIFFKHKHFDFENMNKA